MQAPRTAVTAAALMMMMLVAVVSLPPGTGAQEPPTERNRPRVWVLHDSVMLAAREEIPAALSEYEVNFDGFGGLHVQTAPSIIARQRHLIDEIVVIELGTNYLNNPPHFRYWVQRTLDALAGVDRVIWVTPELYRPEMATVRQILDEEAWPRPNVELADWTSLARNPDYTWSIPDVHLTQAGQWAMADLVAAHVRGQGRYDDAPVGHLALRARAHGLLIKGWAADPDTPGAVDVHIWIDGVRAHTRRAGIDRPDLAHLGYGTRHGYQYVAAVPDGGHLVCIEAVNSTSLRTRFIGCSRVTTANEPIGAANARRLANGSVEVKGWAMDPDGRRPIRVHVRVDGQFVVGGRADRLRRDVAEKYGNGNRHGFRLVIDPPAGAGQVCVHGINIRAGVRNPAVGCVPVPA